MFRVTLEFRDAGMFQHPRKPKGAEHTMLTPSGPVSRKETEAYIDDVPADTVLHDCVVNMFRVLTGTRPVPTFRGATSMHSESATSGTAERLAARARIRVTSGMYTDNRDGSYRFVYEPQITNKAWNNAWMRAKIPWAGKDPLDFRVSWRSVESEFGDLLYQKFMDMVAQVLGDAALDLDLVTVFGRLYESKDPRVLEFCSSPEVSKFYLDTIVYGESIGRAFGHSGLHQGLRHWMWALESKGLSRVNRRSGTIVVDADVSDVEALDNGFGHATLLDGGVVRLVGVTEIDDSEPGADGKQTYHRQRT
jgi:hypothetical protein